MVQRIKKIERLTDIKTTESIMMSAEDPGVALEAETETVEDLRIVIIEEVGHHQDLHLSIKEGTEMMANEEVEEEIIETLKTTPTKMMTGDERLAGDHQEGPGQERTRGEESLPLSLVKYSRERL